MERFIPDGFVTTEIATLVMARRSNPKLWAFDCIPMSERRIWLGINVHFNGLFLGPALFAEREVEISTDAHERLKSFEDALRELRQDLYKGAACGFFQDDTGELVSLEPKCWGQEPADEALTSGKASIGNPPTQRLLLIKMAQQVCGGLQETSKTNAKGRQALEDNLRRYMQAHPDPFLSKDEVLEQLAENTDLSGRQRTAAWNAVVGEFPAYSKAGPRRRPR